MSRPTKFFLGAIALALATLTARAEVKVGGAFPALAEAGLTGGTLPATNGQVVLVDFWASWCAPCKASFPALGKIHADFAARGFVLVAVSVDEKPAAYEGFVKKYSPPFPTFLDREQTLVRQVKVPTMPTSYLIGRDGKVRFVHQGFRGEETTRQLRQEIETLLAEKI